MIYALRCDKIKARAAGRRFFKTYKLDNSNVKGETLRMEALSKRDCRLGAGVSARDFAPSRCSGSAGLLVWMAANAIWARQRA